MTLSSRLVARAAVVIPSIALLLCGLSGTAMSQPTPTGADTQLPGVTVEAPKQMARPHKPVHHAAIRGNRLVSSTPSTAVPTSDVAKLAKLAATTNNCVGGCQSSFKSGDKPTITCAWRLCHSRS